MSKTSPKKAIKRSPQYILAPNQSLKAYKALERTWYSKLAASSFKDIEFLDEWGRTSDYFRVNSSSDLARSYNPLKEAHYRRASIFFHNFNWDQAPLQDVPVALAMFIWEHYAEGYSQRQIVNAINGTGKSLTGKPFKLKLGKGRRFTKYPSLFWVHKRLKEVLMPLFEAWLITNKEAYALEEVD